MRSVLACVAVVVLAGVTWACGDRSGVDRVDERAPEGGTLEADLAEIVRGVPDRGRDPAVLAIDADGEALCSGVLVASNVVLTARHCVALTREETRCPSTGVQIDRDRPPSTLAVFAGDDINHADLVAVGKELLVPNSEVLCGADLALLILDRDVFGISPLAVRMSAPEQGERVRAVGYGRRTQQDPPGLKLLRDHIRVMEVSRAELLIGEAACQGDSGGPALDPSTGEVLGILARGGPSCDGKGVHNVYTRVDLFGPLIAEALARAKRLPRDPAPDGGLAELGDGAPMPTAKKAGKPVTDMGEPCGAAPECSSGVCAREVDGRQYCSRSCGSGDRCPTGYRCSRIPVGAHVCDQSG